MKCLTVDWHAQVSLAIGLDLMFCVPRHEKSKSVSMVLGCCPVHTLTIHCNINGFEQPLSF